MQAQMTNYLDTTVTPKTERVRIGQLPLHLSNQAYKLEVIKGNAWVSIDNDDFVIKEGETVVIQPGHYPGLISALGLKTLEVKILEA